MLDALRQLIAGFLPLTYLQVRQGLLKFPALFLVTPCNLLPGCTPLPDTSEPDPVKPSLGQAVQLGVRHGIQRGRQAQGTA